MEKTKAVLFKVHNNGEFGFDPLRYVDGCVADVRCFTSHRGVHTNALNHVINDIVGDKWALFYCKPNMSLGDGLTLLHTDNDIRRFLGYALDSGIINLFVTHKQQPLSMYYFKNNVWQEEDAAHRCCCENPFQRRLITKRIPETKHSKGFKVNEKGGSGSGEVKMLHEVGVQIDTANDKRKGKSELNAVDVLVNICGVSKTTTAGSKRRSTIYEFGKHWARSVRVNEKGGSGSGAGSTVPDDRVQIDTADDNHQGKSKLNAQDLLSRKTTPSSSKRRSTNYAMENNNTTRLEVVKTYKRAVVNGRAKMVEVTSV